MSFELPKLAYAYDALEPHIDARTMEIHHSKHHQAYTTNLNNAIAGTELEGMSIEDILKVCKDKPAVRNNGGGNAYHQMVADYLLENWQVRSMKPSARLKTYKLNLQKRQQLVLVLVGHGCALPTEN